MERSSLAELLLSFIFLFVYCACGATAGKLAPQSRIVFNDTNSTTIDWVKSRPELILNVELDGKKATIDIVGLHDKLKHAPSDKVILYDYGYVLQEGLGELVYRDSKTVWILANLGPALDGAILVDLADAKILKKFTGRNFSLSPDKTNLAYVSLYGIQQYSSVYVNETMVSPFCQQGRMSDIEMIGTEQSRAEYIRILDALKRPANTYRLDGPIVWKDNSTIEFVNRLADGEDILHNYRETISFPGGEAKSEAKITSQTLKVERVHISPADAQAMLDQARGRDVPR